MLHGVASLFTASLLRHDVSSLQGFYAVGL